MRAVNFDTLEYAEELKKSGMKHSEAEAITKATAKALSQIMESKEIATRPDIISLEKMITATREDIYKLELSVKKDMNDMIWKIITVIGGIQVFTIGLFTFIQHFWKT